MTPQIRSFLISFITVCIIIGTAAIIITYGRGYRFDVSNRAVNSTGLVVVQSDPSGAQIFVNDKLTSATQSTLTLPPGQYTITVTKDGFQPWKKQITIKGEVVNKIEALLLPVNPSLTALTVNGAVSPALSPDGSKLAYVIPEQPQATISGSLNPTKPGIWVLDLVDKPLGLNRDARQIAQSNGIEFENATLTWSPDNTQILAVLPDEISYILYADQLNSIPRQTTITSVQTIWENIKIQRMKEQTATIPKEFLAFASQSAAILALSPDETKILYEATDSASLPPVIMPPLLGSNPTPENRTTTPDILYMYDIKEDRNYLLGPTASYKDTSDPSLLTIRWLPSSRHLLFVHDDRIQIMDYDATNIRTAYAGPFWDNFAVPWASGGKIVILTNLNAQASAVNNLYVVNLR